MSAHRDTHYILYSSPWTANGEYREPYPVWSRRRPIRPSSPYPIAILNQPHLAVAIPGTNPYGMTTPSLEPNANSGSSPYYTSEVNQYATPSSDASGRQFSMRRPSDYFPREEIMSMRRPSSIAGDYFSEMERDAQIFQAEEAAARAAARREHEARLTQEQEAVAGLLLELSNSSPRSASDSSDANVSWNNNVRRWSGSTHHAARRSIEEEVSPTSRSRLVSSSGIQPRTTEPASLPLHAQPPVVAANTFHSNVLPRAVSAANSADTETPGYSGLRCAFEDPDAPEACVMDGSARKCTSEKFGRNKACTKKLAPHWWNWTCRKHYQRKKYDASHNGRFPQYQHECIINQINKFLTFAHSFEFDIKWQLNLGATIDDYHHMLRTGISRERALQDLTARHGASLSSRKPVRQAAMEKFKAELDIAVKVHHLCGDNKTVEQVFAFLDEMYELCQQHSDIKDLELPHIEFLPKRWVLRSVSSATVTLAHRPSLRALTPDPAPVPGAPVLRPSTTQGALDMRQVFEASVHQATMRRDSDMASPPPPRIPSATGQGPLPTPPTAALMPPPPRRPVSRRSPGLAPLQTNFESGYGPHRNHGTLYVASHRHNQSRFEPYPAPRR